MSLRATSVTLRLRPPGQAWQTIQPNPNPGVTLAVDEATISWGRTSPRDHPDPGTINLTLLVPPNQLDLIAYDTELKIFATLEWHTTDDGWTRYLGFAADSGVDRANTQLAHGWITSWTRGLRRPDGRWPFKIRAVDILGRAAATNLAATPWPRQTGTARIAAINAASKAGPLLETTEPAATYPAKDVDNAAALGVIRDACPLGSFAVEGIDRIRIDGGLSLSPSYADGELYGPTAWPLPIPATVIADTGRFLDRTSTVSEVAITCPRATGAEANTITYRTGTGGSYSSSRYTVTSDCYYRDEAPLITWATGIIRESQTPVAQLPTTTLVLNTQHPTPTRRPLAYLVDANYRHMIWVHITDCPPDLDQLQFAAAGEIRISGRTLRVSLTLIPARLFGVRPIKFAHMPQDSRRPRIRANNQIEKTRIEDLRLATFAPPPPLAGN